MRVLVVMNKYIPMVEKLVGVDTIVADVLNAKGCPAHQILLGHNICIVENLNNLYWS